MATHPLPVASHRATVVIMRPSDSGYTAGYTRSAKIEGMPNAPRTPHHTIRVPTEQWQRWVELAKEEGTTVSEVFRSLMAQWERKVLRKRGSR